MAERSFFAFSYIFCVKRCNWIHGETCVRWRLIRQKMYSVLVSSWFLNEVRDFQVYERCADPRRTPTGNKKQKPFSPSLSLFHFIFVDQRWLTRKMRRHMVLSVHVSAYLCVFLPHHYDEIENSSKRNVSEFEKFKFRMRKIRKVLYYACASPFDWLEMSGFKCREWFFDVSCTVRECKNQVISFINRILTFRQRIKCCGRFIQIQVH